MRKTRRPGSLIDISESLISLFRVKPGSRDAVRIHRAMRYAQINGIKLAAAVAEDYDQYSSHPYLVSECILGKLNVMAGKPAKNPHAKDIDQVLTAIERRVDSIEATTTFLARTARMKWDGPVKARR
jgi:hypothetical protein